MFDAVGPRSFARTTHTVVDARASELLLRCVFHQHGSDSEHLLAARRRKRERRLGRNAIVRSTTVLAQSEDLAEAESEITEDISFDQTDIDPGD